MSAPIALIGRILLALMFVIAGASKFGGLDGTVGYIASQGLPLPKLLAVATAVLEVVAGLMIIIGYRARLAAVALALFTLLAALLFHDYWTLPAEQQMMQELLFMKNLSIAGGLLLLAALGAGALSLDARRPAKA